MVSTDRSPWALLGITPGADAAEIRRAYAKRLKEIRPDEDAEGFQRLVEARDLALRLASGTRADARLAGGILAYTFDTDGNRAPRTRHEPPVAPRRATAPPEFSAADPSAEVSAGSNVRASEDVLDALQRTLTADDLAGWQSVVRAMSALTHRQRAAMEIRLIVSLSAFAARESRDYASWPPHRWPSWPANKWPFFDLVAGLSEEFGWHQNDRVLYEALDEDAAHHFAALLRWARKLSPVSAGAAGTGAPDGSLGPMALHDLHHFYDGGRDQRGLNAYWAMVNDPGHWRPCDAATYLFFPVWSWQDGRYARSLLGVLGWTALVLAFAPWRSTAVMDTLLWLMPLPADLFIISVLPMLIAIWCFNGSYAPPLMTFDGRAIAQSKFPFIGPLWDNVAFFLFPLWAFRRRLYVRAAIGFAVWIAIAYQMLVYPEVLQNDQPDAGFISAVMLVLALHATAGGYGQRWVVYQLQRTIGAADRRRIFDPRQRADFLRRWGTRNPWPWTSAWRRKTRRSTRSPSRAGLSPWWKWAMLVFAASAIVRIVEVLFR